MDRKKKNDFFEQGKESEENLKYLRNKTAKAENEKIEITENFQKKINKFYKNNEVNVNFCSYLRNKMCPKDFRKKTENEKTYDTINFINQKFERKIDIFNYLRQLNKLKIFEKIFFSQNNLNMLKLITNNKSFRYNLDYLKKNKIMNTQERTNEQILEFLMDANEAKPGEIEQNMINVFIGN